jgi:hypothetical protein
MGVTDVELLLEGKDPTSLQFLQALDEEFTKSRVR